MNIHKMHTTFRALGQRMGMQQIRAILPESIDTVLIQAINEKARSIVMANSVTAFKDRVSIQDNSLVPINALRTLYKVEEIEIDVSADDNGVYRVPVFIDDVMFYTSFSIDYHNGRRRFSTRFIDGDKLDDTLNDYCGRASWDYPITSMYSDKDDKEVLEIHIDSTTKIPDFLYVRYIREPVTVKWDANLANCVDCDLPSYLHPEIVESAVSKYFKALGATVDPIATS